LLGQVVAFLVVAVDGAFDLGYIGVGSVGGAGAVFGVPEVEVGAVLGQDGALKGMAGGDDVEGIVMPEPGGAVVETRNFDRGKVKGISH
jgi:hypothetical protein